VSPFDTWRILETSTNTAVMSLAELPAALVRTGMRILIALTAMAIRSRGIKRWK
jgi:hypothetical protein